MSCKILKFILLQMINICLIKLSFAQNYIVGGQNNLNQFSTEHGLSQGNVYQVLKDKDGFVWIASEDGLNRFDGYTFNVYKHDVQDSTSISDNTIWCITEDSKGTLWVGTNQGGLCRYNKTSGNFSRFVHDPANPASLSQNTVTVIFESSDQQLWIGTHWGLNILNPKEDSFRRLLEGDANDQGLLSTRIFSILETQDQEIWVGTSAGISIYSLDGSFLRNISPNEKNGLAKGKVTNMILDEEGAIWIGAEGSGLLKYTKSEKKFTLFESNANDPNSLGNNYIRSLLIDKDGNFWVGMDGFGFQIFNRRTKKFDRVFNHSSFEPDQREKTYEIYQDKDGNLWFGSYGYGFFVFNSNSQNFKHYKRNPVDLNSLSNNSILAIAESSDGNIWLGTDGGGISLFDPESDSFKPVEPRIALGGGKVVKSLLVDDENRLWVGSFNQGLTVFSEQHKVRNYYSTTNSVLTNDNIWSLLQDSRKNIWIGTLGGGLYLFDQKKQTLSKWTTDFDRDSTLSGINVSCLIEDNLGQVWVGTGGHGLVVFDPNGTKSIRFGADKLDASKLSHNEIRSLCQTKDSLIWIGTTYGLNKYNPIDKTFEKYYKADGLPSNVIKGIIEDEKGHLWLSSNNGICKFNPVTNEVFTYTGSDGLQGKEFNYNSSIRSSTGVIYMGGIRGFNTFSPDLVENNKTEPEILFTNFLLFNKPVSIDSLDVLTKEINQLGSIEFNYDQYIFTIEYAVDEYKFPKQNKYQYKLEGFEPDWNVVGGSRSATYTNLPPGKYTFLVRATNNAGIWSDKIRKLNITVNPPWWNTRWMYALMFTLGVLTVLIIVRLRTSYLLSQKVRLRQLVSKRTKELEEKNERITMQARELNAFNDKLNSVNETLEKTVLQRTNELIKKNKILSDYAFMNAHNLRVPVANIKGIIQLFEFQLTSDERAKWIEKLKGQSDDLDRALLDITQRLENDKPLE